MQITLCFFASIREALGSSRESLRCPEQVQTVAQLRHFLQQRGGVWADVLADRRAVLTACNQVMCDGATMLSDGCEVAFFPPVPCMKITHGSFGKSGTAR